MLTATEEKDENGKYRLVTQEGVIALRSDSNAPLDGGGNSSRESVLRQAGYLKDWTDKRESE